MQLFSSRRKTQEKLETSPSIHKDKFPVIPLSKITYVCARKNSTNTSETKASSYGQISPISTKRVAKRFSNFS